MSGNVAQSDNPTTVTNPGALRAQIRQAYGADLPPVLDVTSFMSGALPLALPAASSFLTPLMPSCGAPHVACSITPSQPGTLVMSGHLDSAGLILASTATAAASAGVACILDASSSSLFHSWSLNIQNTSASNATKFLLCRSWKQVAMGAGFKGTRRNGKPKQFSPQNRGEYEQALKWTDRMAKRRQDREQRRKLQEQTPVQRGEPTP